MILETPLYVRGYSQGVLNKALNGDTQFLSSQLVMDYSLLVGIDDETNQLIVGLIGQLFPSLQSSQLLIENGSILCRLYTYVHMG